MPKKRSHGDGGLYYLKSRKLWRGVIDVGFKPDGRRDQKYVHAKTQAEARRKLDDLKKELAEHGRPIDKSMTVKQWAEHWLENIVRPNVAPNTLSTYTSLTTRWIVPTLGPRRVALLKPSDVREVSRAVIDAGRSSSTAQRVHNCLSTMLEAARLDRVTGRNVAKDVTAPKAAESNRDALEMDTAFKVIRYGMNTPGGSRWLMSILCGMRQGERIGATIDSLNLSRVDPVTGEPAPTLNVQWSLTEATFEHGCDGTCSVKRAGSCPQRRLILPDGFKHRTLDGRLILGPPKSGKPRTIPLLPELARKIQEDLDATGVWPNPHGLIYRNEDGSPITPSQDGIEWRAMLLAAGAITNSQALPPKDRPAGTPDTPTSHWGRHTTATVLRRLGVPEYVVTAIVGHVSGRTTDIYTHMSEGDAVAAMRAVGGHFRDALYPMS